MKFLKKIKIGKIFKGVLKVADKVALGGAVQNVLEEEVDFPKGKLNTIKLIKTIATVSVPVLLVLALLFGIIDVEQLKELLSHF